MNKNELASFQTRNKILEIARRKFVTKGFHHTALQEIVEEIGLTRGAFYHHFKKKEEILKELLSVIQEEVAAFVEERALREEDPWEQLVAGSVAFVEKAVDEEIVQLFLIDGPAIISWEEWKKQDRKNSESKLEEQLFILKKEGRIKNLNLSYLISFISGGLNELAIRLSREASFDRKEVEETVRSMLGGIKKDGEEVERLL